MKKLSHALITPSFGLDLQRCEMLVESVDRWVSREVRHYLVIDRRDVPLFRHLSNARTELLVVEDIVPGWMIRIPFVRKFWLSLRTRPVKNWILQQIVKLSIPSTVNEDVLLYSDSDVFFIAPYDPQTYVRDGRVPLFVETGQRGLIRDNDRWHGVAARLLGLPVETGYDTSYIGNVICWRRSNGLALQDQLQTVANRRWQQALANLDAFSEYTLYGQFCQEILKDRAEHWNDGLIRTLNHWRPVPLDIAGLERLKAQREAHHHSVMVSAKSRTAVADIRKVFF